MLSRTTANATVSNVRLGATGATSAGVFASFGGATTIDHSTIHGARAAIEIPAGQPVVVRAGASRLSGGPVLGNVTCAGVYDENYTFFPNTCP